MKENEKQTKRKISKKDNREMTGKDVIIVVGGILIATFLMVKIGCVGIESGQTVVTGGNSHVCR
tara:strand:- start:291 stop:482 length:192 start_codon:yes stop_codon:yes gene_type:complete